MTKKQQGRPWDGLAVPEEMQAPPSYPVIQWINHGWRLDPRQERGGFFAAHRFGMVALPNGIEARYHQDDGVFSQAITLVPGQILETTAFQIQSSGPVCLTSVETTVSGFLHHLSQGIFKHLSGDHGPLCIPVAGYSEGTGEIAGHHGGPGGNADGI